MAKEIIHKGAKVYIYSRVSTAMQTDGYSLDAQKERIKKYVDYQEMQIVGEYTDEGKSGKNIIDRDGFQQMIEDITNRKDDVSFVIVFKLSRFGRNVADILSTLKTMNFYGVHLICVEDNIDSSLDSGKLMISILGAMAEIERDNILIQTMAGRKEKARQGKWNGGLPPYGYDLDGDNLVINKTDAEIVRLIFDKYVKTDWGFPSIAQWLNDMGYKKRIRSKNEVDFFTAPFIAKVIDNPTYNGKTVYGRTITVQREDNPDKYHRIKNQDYTIVEGNHEAIINDSIWESSRIKRIETGGKKDKREKDHEYILSSLVVCPQCGKKLIGAPSRGKKRKDGTMYPTYYSYKCRPSISDKQNGNSCKFGQIACDKIDNQVRDIIMNMVDNKMFAEKINTIAGEKVNDKYAEQQLDSAIKDYQKALRLQRELEKQMDELDVFDKHYDRKIESLNRRLDAVFDSLDVCQKRKADAEAQLLSIKQENLSQENVFEALKFFNLYYDKMTDKEKKTFMQLIIEKIEIYPEKSRKNGVSIKSIHFKVPVSYNGENVWNIDFSRPKDNTVETVVLMSRVNTLDK